MTVAHFTHGGLTGVITLKKEVPFPVVRGQVVGPTTHFVPAFIKLLPPHLRMVEVVCAWLACEIGLAIPRPAIVRVRRRSVDRLCKWPYGNANEVYCFGSEEIPQARALQILENARHGQAEQLLSGWKDCLRVGIFDELIANDDRNKGNLLVDAHRNIWIIDHSRALRAGGQTPFSDPLLPFENTLLQRFARLPLSKRHALYPKVVSDCAQMSSVVGRIPYDSLAIDGDVRFDIERFIDARARRLRALVLSRLGISELPLPDRPSAGMH